MTQQTRFCWQRPPWSLLIWGLSLLLLVMGCIAFAKGMTTGFWGPRFQDLRERHVEVLTFLDHHYPNPFIDPRATRPGLVASVYLPYAFPMMVPLFGGGQLAVGQWTVLLLSVAALLVMARYGHRQLRFAGAPFAWLGAVAPLALNGVPQTLADLQFSLICTGLLLVQAELIERRHPHAAGLCWAVAMIKPQIAIPFALLFIARRQLGGLISGSAWLLGLSVFTLTWTGIPLEAVLGRLLSGRQFNFTAGLLPLLDLGFGTTARLNPTTLQWGLIGLAALVMAVLGTRLYNLGSRIDLVNLTGVCSVIGVLAFYHRSYDHVMMFPLLIALMRLSLGALPPTRLWFTLLAVANALVLWRPNNVLSHWPLAPIQSLLWMTAGVVLTMRLVQADHAPVRELPSMS